MTPLLCAQTAQITGFVRDPSGSVIPRATLTITKEDTAAKRATRTNESGLYTVPLLPPGRYAAMAEAVGFEPQRVAGIALDVAQEARLDFVLQIAGTRQTVTVEGTATLINEISPAVSTVVNRSFVENLPLNGRSFHTLFEMTPGVVLTKTSFGSPGQLSVNGQRPDANYFSVDGVGANIGVAVTVNPGRSLAGALPGQSAAGGTSNLVSVDALLEFKIQTSTYAPEFGRGPGAQVSMVTRSGTNQFHGTAFDYLRNDKLDANDWFNNSLRLAKSPERQNDFGGVLGGPVIHDRTFFFFSYEGLRLIQPQTQVVDVPTLAVREAVIPRMKPFAALYPLPNGAERVDARGQRTGFAQFAASYSNPSNLNATSIRLDHRLRDTLTLFGRFNYSPSSASIRGQNSTLTDLNNTKLATETYTAGATWIVSPTISSDLRVNRSRSTGSAVWAVDKFGGAALPDFSTLVPVGYTPETGLFAFSISGGTQTRFNWGKNGRNLQRQFNLVENVSVIKGGHQWKFGLDYRRLTPTAGPVAYNTVATFNDMASFQNGTVGAVSITSRQSAEVLVANYSAFVQDTWKATQRLVLTYGVRWDVAPAPWVTKGVPLLAVTNFATPAALALSSPNTRLFDTSYRDFAPRLGIAYQLFQKPGRQTVLRGGFGLFYDIGNPLVGMAFNGPPTVITKNVGNAAFPLSPDLAAAPPATLNPPFSNFWAFDPNLRMPRVYHWNVALEQALGATQTVTLSYVAAVDRNLLRDEQRFKLNASFPATVNLVRNTATSDYHAMQLQYQRRMSRGLQVLASYVWAHALDDGSDASTAAPVPNFTPRMDRGSSDFDVRHSFSALATYNIPAAPLGNVGRAILRGWSIDPVFRAHGATPVTLATNRTIEGFGITTRPDLVPGVPLYLSDRNVAGGRRFNPAAFFDFLNDPRSPINTIASLRQGTLGRNTLRGFGASQLDFSVRRRFALTERVNLQWRAEFFNIFNHPNFGITGVNIRNATFGYSAQMLGRSLGPGGGAGTNPIYQVGGPRSIQLALKLMF